MKAPFDNNIKKVVKVMKKSKLIVSLLFVLAISVTSVFAQHNPEAMVEHKMEHLTETLHLNEQQQAKIKTILEEGMKKNIALKEQDGERADKKAAFKANREAQVKAIEAILTKEQLVTFEAQKEEMMAKRKEMRQKGQNVDKKALKSEMKAYHEKNVKPVLSEKRRKFDQQLTSNEQQIINEVRAKLQAQKEKMADFKKNHKRGDDISDQQKVQFKASKEAMKTEMDKIRDIAKKYETELKAIHEELAPQAEKWKTDMQNIAQKHGVEKDEMERKRKMKENFKKNSKEEKAQRHHQPHGRKEHHGGYMRGMHMKEMSPVGFILLNPDEAPTNNEVKTSETSIKVFPNPAQNFNNVEFYLATGGDVALELHDQDGNLIKTILNENRPAGNHSVRVNLGDLQGYVYLYILKDAEGNILTEKFVIRK